MRIRQKHCSRAQFAETNTSAAFLLDISSHVGLHLNVSYLDPPGGSAVACTVSWISHLSIYSQTTTTGTSSRFFLLQLRGRDGEHKRTKNETEVIKDCYLAWTIEI